MNIKDFLFFHKPDKHENFVLESNEKKEQQEENFKISHILNKNRDYIIKRFSYPKNNDIVIRDFTLKNERKCFAVLIDGMTNSEMIDFGIIESMLLLRLSQNEKFETTKESVPKKLISHSQVSTSDDINEIIEEVNFGSCAVFVDGINAGYILDVRDWGHRSISKPENEQSIYGPQEAFAEMLRNNSALVRKILKTEHLICEGITVGDVSKTKGVLMYIDNVANESLVDEVRRRIENIHTDYIISIEEVALFIEDNPSSMTNQILATERPDRTARALADGRVALILSGSPRALIFPTTVYELTHTITESYIKVPFANMARLIRIFAMGVSVLLPGIYLAITLFHQEMLPTYLLYAISASRENVPFPSLIELLLMMISFEMIRQAGIQMPGPIGSTLGIVGGLILGQAAVSAKIVSPIMIIIIAITGIGSFATSDYSLSWAHRILRFIFIFLGAIFGFYGIALGIFLYSVLLGKEKSFGVPFLSPIPSNGFKNIKNNIFVTSIWKQEMRPEFLKPKKQEREPKISMKWKQ